MTPSELDNQQKYHLDGMACVAWTELVVIMYNVYIAATNGL